MRRSTFPACLSWLSVLSSPSVLSGLSGLSVLFGLMFLTLTATTGCFAAQPAANTVGLAIVDFVYSDSSGEVTDQVRFHEERLQAFMAALRRHFESESQYHLVSVSCPSTCLEDEDPELSEAVHRAKEGGARLLMVGGIHKMSTLVQWARVRVIDVTTELPVIDRLFTFRGDTDEAWIRAESFVAQEIDPLMVPLAATADAHRPRH